MKKILLFSHTCNDSSVILFFLLFSFISPTLLKNAEKKICQTKECLSSAQNLKESINFDVNPCDDFYKYACGNWQKLHKNSNSSAQGTLQLRSDENEAEIFDFLEQNNRNDEPEAVHKARKLFSLCMSKAAYSNKLEPMELILQKIGISVCPFSSKNVENYDYTTALAKATRLAGVEVYFSLGSIPNPYNRTVNIIGLRKPGTGPDILPLASQDKLYRSKRAAKNIDEQDYMTEITKKMCDNITSISCKQWILSVNFTRDSLIEKISEHNDQREKIVAKARSTLNSSLPVIYTLRQLQDLTYAIATNVNSVVPQLNWTRYIEEMYSGLDNMTLDLRDPNKVQIAIEELDFVKDMVKFIYRSEDVKTIGIYVSGMGGNL